MYTLICCQAQINISCNYHLPLNRSPEQQEAEMEMACRNCVGRLSGSPRIKGKGGCQGQAEEEVGCSAASAEVSATITGELQSGEGLSELPQIGVRRSGIYTEPTRSSVIGCGLPQEGSGITGEVALFS